MTLTELGKRIRAVRKAKGLTQEQVEEQCGISQSTLSAWENGTNEPGVIALIQLADALGVSCDEFRPSTADRATKPRSPK